METATRTAIFGGKPHALAGRELKAGDKAPGFKLQANDMSEIDLSMSKGKVRLLSVVVSLDTPVCDLQTQWFEEEASKYKNVVIYAISMDLPFAQARYCGAHNIKSLKTLSDHLKASFGRAYGVLMSDLHLLSRAIFIIDANNYIRYVEYVPDASHQPDYDKAIDALKTVAGA